jgi:hypothetical protein
MAAQYARLEPYGFMIVILLLATGVLGTLMWPIMRAAEYLVAALAGF